MKIKWGALVVDGRNKIGGHVATKNRSGAVLRTKVSPVNPGSTYQVNVRNRFGGLSSAWKGLDPAERTAWNAAVANYAKTDIFGDLRNPSGFNLHQKLNNNLVNIAESAITTPPLPEAVDAFVSHSCDANFAGQTFKVHFAPVIAATHKVLVFATPPVSAGISFVKSEFRQLFVMDDGFTTPYVASALYIAKFGAIGAVGSKIFVRLVQVNITTGQAGIPIQSSCIID